MRTTEVDTIALLRADFETRRVDTISRLKSMNGKHPELIFGGANGMVFKLAANPLPNGDEWAVLSDGSVAIVRGADYHIDWINPDGSTRSTGKMPFAWRRGTDDERRARIDSTQKSIDQTATLRPSVPSGGAGGGAASGTSRVSGGAAPPSPQMRTERRLVPPGEIPDYYPPFRIGSVRADLDGNVWILPTTTAQSLAGELVYDVVNLRGELFQRVRVPAGRSIAGFARGGVVYLMNGDLTNGFVLERTRIK
jgi:hypothetical protein